MWKVNRIVFITGLLGVTLTGADRYGSTKSDLALRPRSQFELEPQRISLLPSRAPATPLPGPSASGR